VPQLAGILDGHAERVTELLSAPQVVAIDAARPLERVAGDVIAYTQAREATA
jgi:ubiquinone biosynthesis protein UbiJ